MEQSINMYWGKNMKNKFFFHISSVIYYYFIWGWKNLKDETLRVSNLLRAS